MFLTSPYIEQAITRFDRWSLSVMAIFQQPPNFLCKIDRFVYEDCFIVDQP
jgi:hypothetical protein